MARTKKDLLPMDELIARYLREGVESTGTSYRTLATATGMSANRIGIILRQEPPPATIGELSRIASALGLSASELMSRAERELASERLEPNASLDLVGQITEDEVPDSATAKRVFIMELKRSAMDQHGSVDGLQAALRALGYPESSEHLTAVLDGVEYAPLSEALRILEAVEDEGAYLHNTLMRREELELVANESIAEHPAGDDADFDNA